MKSTFLTAIIFVSLALGSIFHAQAQSTVLKINPLSLVVLTPNVKVEHAFSESMSVQLGVYYTKFGFGVEGDRFVYSGFGITPEFRYYFTHNSKDAPQGFFGAPFFRYTNFNTGVRYDDPLVEDDIINFSTIGGGFVAGYQWIFGEVFALEFFAGPSFVSRKITDITGDVSEEDLRGVGDGIGIRAGMSIGAAF